MHRASKTQDETNPGYLPRPVPQLEQRWYGTSCEEIRRDTHAAWAWERCPQQLGHHIINARKSRWIVISGSLGWLRLGKVGDWHTSLKAMTRNERRQGGWHSRSSNWLLCAPTTAVWCPHCCRNRATDTRLAQAREQGRRFVKGITQSSRPLFMVPRWRLRISYEQRLCVLLGSQGTVCAGMWLQMGLSPRPWQPKLHISSKPRAHISLWWELSPSRCFGMCGPRIAKISHHPGVV